MLERARRAELLGGLMAAIERDPRHDLRMGEMLRPPRTSQMPSSGSCQICLEMLEQVAWMSQRVSAAPACRAAVM